MKKLVKNSDNDIVILFSVDGSIPNGYTEVSEEEMEAAQATIASKQLDSSRNDKLSEIRAAREAKLKRADILCNLAYLNSWTTQEKNELKAYRQALLDITNSYKTDPASLDNLDVSAIQWPTEPTT
jgi:hypothetical protein